MTKPFDVASKTTWEIDPDGFVNWLGYGDEPSETIDADVSTVSGSTDKVIRVGQGRNRWLLMIEFLSSYKRFIPSRTHWHSTLLGHRHRLRVRSVIWLLRPEADGPAMSGQFVQGFAGEDPYLRFDYRVVRPWQIAPEKFLQAGPGLLPFAPISAVQPSELAAVVHETRRRLERQVSEDRLPEMLTMTYVLMGLRYDKEVVEKLSREVLKMEDSVTYQAIRDDGRLASARQILLDLGEMRLGRPNRKVIARVDRIAEFDQLQGLLRRLFECDTWDELMSITT